MRFSLNINYFIILIAFFNLCIVQSPLLALLPIPGFAYVLFCFVLLLVFLTVNKVNINYYIFIILGVFIPTTILCLYWGDLRYFSIAVTLFVAIFCVELLKYDDIKVLIDKITHFMIVLLVLCWIGFFIAQLRGGSPVLTFNLWGRDLHFFYTTFTVDVTGSFMRPSGIYMEPGHLGWIVSCLIFCRELLGLNSKKSLILVFLSVITFSLALYFFILFYVLYLFKFREIIKFSFVFIFTCILLYFIVPFEFLNSFILSRFDYQGGEFAGDNRSFRMINAFDLIDFKSFIFGLGPTCFYDYQVCENIYGFYGENPLSPILNIGFILSYLYYTFLIFLMCMAFKFKMKYFFLIVGLILIFLQQPILLQVGYSMWPILIFSLFLRSKELE